MPPKIALNLSIFATILYMFSLFLPALNVSRFSLVTPFDQLVGTIGLDVLGTFFQLLGSHRNDGFLSALLLPVLIGDGLMVVAPLLHRHRWQFQKPPFLYQLLVSLLTMAALFIGGIACMVLLSSPHTSAFISHFVWIAARLLWWGATVFVASPVREYPSTYDFSQS